MTTTKKTPTQYRKETIHHTRATARLRKKRTGPYAKNNRHTKKRTHNKLYSQTNTDTLQALDNQHVYTQQKISQTYFKTELSTLILHNPK